MFIPDMHMQVRLDIGRVRAVGTGEGFDAEVDREVALQVPEAREFATAHFAFVRANVRFFPARGVGHVPVVEIQVLFDAGVIDVPVVEIKVLARVKGSSVVAKEVADIVPPLIGGRIWGVLLTTTRVLQQMASFSYSFYQL